MASILVYIETRGGTVLPISFELLDAARKLGASDVHLKVGRPPIFRIRGQLRTLKDVPAMNSDVIETFAVNIMNQRQHQHFMEACEVDLAYGTEDGYRYRVNVFRQRGNTGMVMRIIPSQIPSFDRLNLPQRVRDLSKEQRGLVLVTGTTGSGKSTTLAAMVNHLNENEYGHVLTVEDPIEFVHESKKCLVNQREVGPHTMSFNNALRSALREDPDAILVGEMRDLETIRLALTAAETGHLVFGTLHTSSAAKTIDRVVDVFPAAEKDMVRAMLSESLVAVISQSLCKLKDGSGRVAAHEIMIATSAIKNLIRENKIAQMYSSIQTGSSLGMQTLDQNLADLVRRNVIAAGEARAKAKFPENFPG